MKIKVLHIIKSLGRGGAEMLLPETLALHNQQKFEFHYIYFLPWKDQMVSAIESEGGAVSCLSANNNIALVRKYSEVIRYIKKHNIDIIHAHLPWAGFLARFVHELQKIPVIYTEHNKQERYHRVTFGLNKFTFSWQNQVVAVSSDVKNSISKNIGKKVTVKTILNGVNTEKFIKLEGDEILSFKRNLGIKDEELVVGTIAVFRFQKRLKEWLQVFKKASDYNPLLKGVIVGDGPLKEELYEERKRLGLEDKVLMPGLQTNTIEWFSAMDVFMMTSVFEGLPIALLEAMSMKCAILTTDAGGVKEVIEDGISGKMVSVNKWMDLSNMLSEIDKDTIENLGEAARKRVETRFSLKVMVQGLEATYLRVLNEQNGN